MVTQLGVNTFYPSGLTTALINMDRMDSVNNTYPNPNGFPLVLFRPQGNTSFFSAPLFIKKLVFHWCYLDHKGILVFL